MGDETVAAAVPAALLVTLREAFGREVEARIPSLESCLGPNDDLEAARRDAHTLASGAWVVGERDIARLARAVENELPEGPVEELLVLLRGYAP